MQRRKRKLPSASSSVSCQIVESKMATYITNKLTETTEDCQTLISNYSVAKCKMQNSPKLTSPFFFQPCIDLARGLLGKILVRKLASGKILKGKIVETECYLGVQDKACHSYNGKVTERNAAMFMKPGTAYVYIIYGIYFCFNISSLEEGSAVLIRSLEPLMGEETMQTLRFVKRKSTNKLIKVHQLCNGPSKLCEALQITKNELNKVDLSKSDLLWLENGARVENNAIVQSKRIGIGSAGDEWANKPLRFYIRGCQSVSIRDRVAEQNSLDS